ncbi:MAG: hypothetical protein LBR17_07000 [Bacteroidales bacterium]|jgi:hypothetical protein|nr:hypothetical protein [Bacteroidales bacterium]
MKNLSIFLGLLFVSTSAFGQIDWGEAEKVANDLRNTLDREFNNLNDRGSNSYSSDRDKTVTSNSSNSNYSSNSSNSNYYESVAREIEEKRIAEEKAKEKAKVDAMRPQVLASSKVLAPKIRKLNNATPFQESTVAEKNKSTVEQVMDFSVKMANGKVISEPLQKRVAVFIENDLLADIPLPAEYNKKISNTIAKKVVGNKKLEKLIIPRFATTRPTLLQAGMKPQAIDNADWVANNVPELCAKIEENIDLFMNEKITIEQYIENSEKIISSFKKSLFKQVVKNFKSL